MASPITYYWQAGDTRWWVARKFYATSGYSSPYALVAAINAANPQIFVWRTLAPQTPILIPSQQAT